MSPSARSSQSALSGSGALHTARHRASITNPEPRDDARGRTSGTPAGPSSGRVSPRAEALSSRGQLGSVQAAADRSRTKGQPQPVARPAGDASTRPNLEAARAEEIPHRAVRLGAGGRRSSRPSRSSRRSGGQKLSAGRLERVGRPSYYLSRAKRPRGGARTCTCGSAKSRDTAARSSSCLSLSSLRAELPSGSSGAGIACLRSTRRRTRRRRGGRPGRTAESPFPSSTVFGKPANPE